MHYPKKGRNYGFYGLTYYQNLPNILSLHLSFQQTQDFDQSPRVLEGAFFMVFATFLPFWAGFFTASQVISG